MGPMPEGKRIAIYARVSKEDRGQEPENQLLQLRAWCGAAGHQVVGEYVEYVSGGKSADSRPNLPALMDHAHRRRFDAVPGWAPDRIHRGGVVPAIGDLQPLRSY